MSSKAEKSGSAKTAMTLVAAFVHPEGYEFSEELTVENHLASQFVFVKELVQVKFIRGEFYGE